MYCYPTYGSVTNLVFTILWEYRGTDGSNSSYITNRTDIPYDPNAEYAEGSGSVAPCRGCANKSSLQQSEGSSLRQDERKQKDQDSDDEVKDLTTGVVESQDETKSQRVMILDGEIEGIPFVERPFDDGFTNFPKDIQFSLRDDILPAISKW